MEQPGHTYNVKTLIRVYVGLLALLVLMVAISQVPMKKWPVDFLSLHTVQAAAIFSVSVVMMVIVAGFLMGLKYEKSWLNVVIFCSNFAFLLIFITFVMADIAFRGNMDPSFTKAINWQSPVLKANAADQK